jgi:Protein of unknown function (DUF2975)
MHAMISLKINIRGVFMKQFVSTILLKTVIILLGIASLAFCIFLLPNFANQASEIVPAVAFLKYPFLICMYAALATLFFALFNGMRLIGYIEKDKVFSELSIMALKRMKLSGYIMTALLYFSGMPAIYLVAEVEDAPGLIFVGFAIASIPLVVATFVAILQRHLREAVDMKSENDFTV